MTQPLCETCKFWAKDAAATAQSAGPAVGLCRVNPPTIMVRQDDRGVFAGRSTMTMIPVGMWPPTEADDWCGRHERAR